MDALSSTVGKTVTPDGNNQNWTQCNLSHLFKYGKIFGKIKDFVIFKYIIHAQAWQVWLIFCMYVCYLCISKWINTTCLTCRMLLLCI